MAKGDREMAIEGDQELDEETNLIKKNKQNQIKVKKYTGKLSQVKHHRFIKRKEK